MAQNTLIEKGGSILLCLLIVLVFQAFVNIFFVIPGAENTFYYHSSTRGMGRGRNGSVDLGFDDLGEGNGSVWFSKTEPIRGEEVSISVMLFNSGDVEMNVSVGFFDGPLNNGDVIGYDTVNIGSGQNKMAGAVWNTTNETENHTIFVVIDPDDLIAESNEDNNMVKRKVSVNQIPVANAGADKEANEDEEAIFDGSASMDTYSDMVSGLFFSWDFGDPHANSSNPNVLEGRNLSEPGHIYTKRGNYTAILRISDDGGAEALDTVKIWIHNVFPKAVTQGNHTAYINDSILFDGSNSTDTPSDKGDLRYIWDFGDNTTEEGMIAEHLYGKKGTYNASLRVIDDDLFESVRNITIEIMDVFAVTRIHITANLTRDIFYPNETIIVSGKAEVRFILHKDVQDFIAPRALITIRIVETGESRSVITARNGDYHIVMRAPEMEGDYTIKTTASYGTMEKEISKTSMVEKETHTSAGSSIRSLIIAATAVGAVSGITALVASTDLGRYKFFTLMLPLYTRLKRDSILNQFTRGKVYGYIVANPGSHYSDIRRALKMKNGSLAYHLQVLEREEQIKSKRDGIYKCFYPKDATIPPGAGNGWLRSMKLDADMENIIDTIEAHPNLTQTELVKFTGLERSKVSRKVGKLIAQKIVHATAVGNVKHYRLDSTLKNRFRICPFCGRDLKIILIPKYCPYCKRKLARYENS